MAQYLSPGVYVEEAPPASRSIAGVGTSTACFLGVVPDDVKMPNRPGLFKKDANNQPAKDANGRLIPVTSNDGVIVPYDVAKVSTPVLITSWVEFKNSFGDFQPKKEAVAGPPPTQGWNDQDYNRYCYLQHAVYGFFNNGGTRCWVMRVASISDLTGAVKLKGLLDKFAAIDEIALVIAPGANSQDDHQTILNHCSELEDRFAILDGVKEPNPLTASNIAPAGRSKTGSYGAVYFPWIKVSDPLSTVPQMVTIPPSGHIAGIYARSDGNRGVYKAPANEEVRGALDLDAEITRAKQDGLNPDGINVLRAFNGTIKVWGARTRADEDNSQFRYVSTRRYFNFLRESIDEATQFVVFEPNTPALWQSITRDVNEFLLGQWRDGALFGSTAQQAFFVKCDAETNPADVRERGQVVTLIGVAIVKPAEFVIFRIQQMTGG